jgi:hypothetical protein
MQQFKSFSGLLRTSDGIMTDLGSRPIYRQGSYHFHLKVPPQVDHARQKLLSIRHRKSDLGIKKLGATCFLPGVDSVVKGPTRFWSLVFSFSPLFCLVVEINDGANRPSEE